MITEVVSPEGGTDPDGVRPAGPSEGRDDRSPPWDGLPLPSTWSIAEWAGQGSSGRESLPKLLEGSTEKRFREGTDRLCHPQVTLAKIGPYIPSLGITRIANVTGLDRIGIPVYMVMRPGSRFLSVAQGKGADATAAKVSGIMESLEAHHAEFPTLAAHVESWEELGRHLPLADPMKLPLTRKGVFSSTVALPWVEGYDLIGQGPMWVPFEAVHVNMTVPPVAGSGWFTRTTNGLASGNSLTEAVLHALCEVVERDAEARWNHCRSETLATTRLDLESVEDPLCRRLLDLCEAARITVMAWSMRTVVGLPAVRVVVFDRQSDTVVYPAPAARGSGCHPNRALAFSRALTEAVQSRLTVIAGSRDDITRATYRRIQSPQVLAFQQRSADERGSIDFEGLPSVHFATLEEDVSYILHGLCGAGFRHAVAVDLSRPGWPVNVVKVIIPGLALHASGARRPLDKAS